MEKENNKKQKEDSVQSFVSKKSVMLKIVDIGNISGKIKIFEEFTVDGVVIQLKDAVEDLLEALKTIPYEAPAAG